VSTLRYFLGGRVRLTYLDSGFVNGRGGYRCHVKTRDGASRKVFVGEPAHRTRSVDSPEAFDDVARAAIAFAEEDGFSIEYDHETVGHADRIRVARRAS
jgi:hypothetical protein